MSIGFTVCVEFTTDGFKTVDHTRCATPNGIFFWQHHWLLELLGLPVSEEAATKHPFGIRGWPPCLSRNIVSNNYVLISNNSGSTASEKKRTRRYSVADEAAWKNQGLEISSIPNEEMYQIDKTDSERVLLNPGCERPSWLTCAEMTTVLESFSVDIRQHSERRPEEYNRSVLRWILDIGSIYGNDCVRMVYWFDSLPQRFLQTFSE